MKTIQAKKFKKIFRWDDDDDGDDGDVMERSEPANTTCGNI